MTMIRLEYYLRRNPTITASSYRERWEQDLKSVWSELALALDCSSARAQLALDNHPATTAMQAARGGQMETPFDLVVEFWWLTEAQAIEALETRQGVEQIASLVQQQESWLDRAASPAWMAMEFPQVNPTPETLIAEAGKGINKIQFPLRALSHLDEQAVRQYWLQEHGPIIRHFAPHSGILRYVQVHYLNHALNARLENALGFATRPYLGHAEVWSGPSSANEAERREASAAAVTDESTFIDFTQSTLYLAEEQRLK